MEETLNEWEVILINLKIMGNPNSLLHDRSLRFLLDDFFIREEGEVSLADNPELTWYDIYDAYIAILVACFKKAVEDEEYLMLRIIDKAQSTQHQIQKDFITYEVFSKKDREVYFEWLDNTKDYYNQLKQQILKNSL